MTWLFFVKEFNGIDMNFSKILDKLKLMLSWKKENSPIQKAHAKTKCGNPIAMLGDRNSIQQANTINNHYSDTTKSSKEKLIKNLLNEMDYNISPGVGGPKCHFEFAYHNNLLDSNIREDLHEPIRELIKHMKLCNAYATNISLKHPPGSIKCRTKILKEQLIGTLPFLEKTEPLD